MDIAYHKDNIICHKKNTPDYVILLNTYKILSRFLDQISYIDRYINVSNSQIFGVYHCLSYITKKLDFLKL